TTSPSRTCVSRRSQRGEENKNAAPQGGILSLLFHAADELTVFGVQHEGGAGAEVAGEQLLRDERLRAGLQAAAQGARAVERVVAALDYEVLGSVGELQRERLVRKALFEALDHDVDDAAQVLARQGLEHDDLVQPVEELRPERALELAHDLGLRLGRDAPVRPDALQQILAAQVARQDDDSVFEVHRAALAVRYAAVVQDL